MSTHDNPRYDKDGNEETWHEVRFVYAPTVAGDSSARALMAWAEANGFRVVDWCIWERADGSRMTIDPVPPPHPHGFEESVAATRSGEAS